MEQNEIDVLKKFMDADLVDRMANPPEVEVKEVKSKKPESLEELYYAYKAEHLDMEPMRQYSHIPEEWMHLDNFGEIRFNPQQVRAYSRRGSRITLFFDIPLLAATFPDDELIALFQSMPELPRRQGI